MEMVSMVCLSTGIWFLLRQIKSLASVQFQYQTNFKKHEAVFCLDCYHSMSLAIKAWDYEWDLWKAPLECGQLSF